MIKRLLFVLLAVVLFTDAAFSQDKKDEIQSQLLKYQ